MGHVLSRLHARADGDAPLEALVIGDVLLDDYLSAAGTRLAREAPVPAVTVGQRRPVPGGAGNLAANLAALGARVRLVAAVGDDVDGVRLREALTERGVDVEDVLVDPGRRTLAKRRILADGQVVFRFDEGSTTPLAPAAADEVSRRVAARLAGSSRPDVVLVSDYDGGTVTSRVLGCLEQLLGARRPDLPVVVDAHDVARFAGLRPTLVTPNASEAHALVADAGIASGPDRPAAVQRAASRLLRRSGAQAVAVTLDRDGAVVVDADGVRHRTTTTAEPDRHSCGAGDSYASAFALALAVGAPTPVAADLAQSAAAVVTRRGGTTTCSLADLAARVGAPGRAETALTPLADVADAVAAARAQGRRIVLTNGCFDLLHPGHVDLLARAKALGDVLVVALNDDAGVAALKGEGRPVNPLPDRARVLAALSCVDHVVAFGEPTAVAVVEALRPDVLVKGDDHDVASVPEADAVRAVGGEVRLLPCAPGGSTATLIRRIVDVTPASAALAQAG
ncbi:MAG: PfkB family carbohydrate kinase [Kineosporiaceae bacterium]